MVIMMEQGGKWPRVKKTLPMGASGYGGCQEENGCLAVGACDPKELFFLKIFCEDAACCFCF